MLLLFNFHHCSSGNSFLRIIIILDSASLLTILFVGIILSSGLAVATGSLDSTCRIWQIKTGAISSSAGTDFVFGSEKDSGYRACVPTHTLYAHDEAVTGVIASSELDIVVSCSLDGSAVVTITHTTQHFTQNLLYCIFTANMYTLYVF